MSKVVIIGAGAMGTAFAVPCIDNNHDTNILGTHLENNFIDNNRKWCKTVNTFKLYEKKLVNSELKSVKVNEMKYEKVREINLIFRKFNK